MEKKIHFSNYFSNNKNREKKKEFGKKKKKKRTTCGQMARQAQMSDPARGNSERAARRCTRTPMPTSKRPGRVFFFSFPVMWVPAPHHRLQARARSDAHARTTAAFFSFCVYSSIDYRRFKAPFDAPFLPT
jgi:hypothetical protein